MSRVTAIANHITLDPDTRPTDAIQEMMAPGVFLPPSNDDLADAEKHFTMHMDRELVLVRI